MDSAGLFELDIRLTKDEQKPSRVLHVADDLLTKTSQIAHAAHVLDLTEHACTSGVQEEACSNGLTILTGFGSSQAAHSALLGCL